MRFRRLLVAVALTVAGAGLAAAPAGAQSTGGDNTAAAVNTRDGSTVFKLAFSVTRALGDTVNSTNAAVAYASCTDCRTVAIAFQIVFVVGSPSTFTPTNEAISINYQCVQCDTFAAAYQFVVQASGPVHLTADGYRRLHEIERQIRALDGTMTDAELRAALDSYAAQIYQVLQTEVVAGPALPAATGDIGANGGSTTTTTGGASAATTATTGSTTSTTAPPTSTTASTTSTTTAPTATVAP